MPRLYSSRHIIAVLLAHGFREVSQKGSHKKFRDQRGLNFFGGSSPKSFCPRNDTKTLESLIDELSWGFELHETFTLKQGITFKLSNAGHILGSCFIFFTFPDQQGKDFRVIFSGDLGCTNTPILPDPDPLRAATC